MPVPPPQAADLGGGLGSVFGLEILETGEERARGRFEVGTGRQPLELLHGGVFACLAESICHAATDRALAGGGMAATGCSSHTTFLRPVTAGTVSAKARRRHRGRRTWVWEVDFSDAGGCLCGTSRVTLAVRPAPSGDGEPTA